MTHYASLHDTLHLCEYNAVVELLAMHLLIQATACTTDDLKNLQEKLKQAELKSAELRNQVQTQKNELKLMQKVGWLLNIKFRLWVVDAEL